MLDQARLRNGNGDGILAGMKARRRHPGLLREGFLRERLGKVFLEQCSLSGHFGERLRGDFLRNGGAARRKKDRGGEPEHVSIV